jgi:hypothetical protein
VSLEQVLEWLAAREPAAPAPLAARLLELARVAPTECLGGTMTETMSALGRFALVRSLGRGETGNDVALDLLAADAFVTYAFEAAAEEGADVRRAVTDLLTRMPS